MKFGFFSGNIGLVMAYETLIDERVNVWVFFKPSKSGSIIPIAMSWHKRLIKFQGVIFTTTLKIGEVKLINLVCRAQGANFELEYNTDTHLWKLKKVMPRE